MIKFFLAAGVAALAIAAPAAAGPGGHGGGHGGGGGNKGQAGQGQQARGHSSAKVERRGGGGGQRLVMTDRGGRGHAQKAERQFSRVAKLDHVNRHEQRFANRVDRRDVVRDRDLRRDNRFDGRGFSNRGLSNRGLVEGCPPGLWKKDNGCLPPGQAKKLDLVGRMIPASYRNGIVPLSLRDLYRDNDDYYYRYGDGYMYRVDRRSNLIASLLPLLGGGLMTGQRFPQNYMNSYVPSYYQSFYPDTSDNYYRYANGNVYSVDPYSGMIQNVIPMYASGYGYGQMLPPTYSAYNVPDQYRSLYYDSADSYYRYAPGAIYQVDPQTSLITAVASLLTGNGLSVGQPLPMGYSAYNVPLGYRDQYADSSDAWYRYNNGYIYQVDPTSQLVTSIIRAIV